MSLFRYNPEIHDDPEFHRRQHGYNRNQPRVPAGHSDGGQWMRTGGGSAPLTRLAALQASPVADQASDGSAGAAVTSDASPTQFAFGDTSGTGPAIDDLASGAANPRTGGSSPSQPRYRFSEMGTYVQRGYEADLPGATPPGTNVDDNIRAAIVAKARGASDAWFYNQVKNGGPWDYKQQGAQYQDFGNFNYGATGTAFGFSEDTLTRMAGWAQTQAGTSRPEWGVPTSKLGAYLGVGGKSPFGDDPVDNYWIKQGIRYFNEKATGRR